MNREPINLLFPHGDPEVQRGDVTCPHHTEFKASQGWELIPDSQCRPQLPDSHRLLSGTQSSAFHTGILEAQAGNWSSGTTPAFRSLPTCEEVKQPSQTTKAPRRTLPAPLQGPQTCRASAHPVFLSLKGRCCPPAQATWFSGSTVQPARHWPHQLLSSRRVVSANQLGLPV